MYYIVNIFYIGSNKIYKRNRSYETLECYKNTRIRNIDQKYETVIRIKN